MQFFVGFLMRDSIASDSDWVSCEVTGFYTSRFRFAFGLRLAVVGIWGGCTPDIVSGTRGVRTCEISRFAVSGWRRVVGVGGMSVPGGQGMPWLCSGRD